MVNKLILIYLFAFITCTGLLAQDRVYEAVDITTNDHSVHGKDCYNTTSLFLILTDKEEYSLILSCTSYGMFDSHHSDMQISYGSYSFTDTILYLYDAVYGFVMEINGNPTRQLVVNKGLSLICGKSFAFQHVKGFFPVTHISFDKKPTKQKTSKLLAGRYMNCAEGRFELVIQDDYKYQYFIDGFLISCGLWQQNGCFLNFRDNRMDSPFTAMIDENGIITGLLIGNVQQVALSKVTDSHSKVYFGKYQIDIESEQVNCELIIGPEYTYEIQLCFQETDDMVYCAVLSFGHYSYSNEQLMLHDDYYNYDWNIIMRDYTLIKAGHGFAFLDGKRIINVHDESVMILPPSENYLNAIKSEINKFKTQRNNPKLIPGQCEDQNQRYLLKLESDGKYQLFLKDVLLSEGSWTRQNKTLVLHDHQLNHNFTMAIGNRELVSMGIPGEFGGTKFEIPMKDRRGGCSRIRIR